MAAPQHLPGGICIEVRPLLSCANIFLKFSESLKLLKDSLSINVNTNTISICLRKQNMIETKAYLDLSEYFEIESHTMCNLIVEEHNVSFRISIKNIKLLRRTKVINDSTNNNNSNNNDNKGTEKISCYYNNNKNEGTGLAEPLTRMHLTPSSTIDQRSGGLEPPLSFNNNNNNNKNKLPLASHQPEINTHIPLALYCSNCETQLTISSQKYTRILEFPTGSVDSCEFFCHHGPNLNDKLIPATDDIFYGFHYIVLNAATLAKAIKIKEEHIYCRYCLQLLGITILNGMANKLWNETLRLKYDKDNDEVQNQDNDGSNDLQTLYKNLSKTEQIKQLIFHLINEATLDSSIFVQFTKICLKTTYANRQQGYLLLHILEQRLQVLNYKQPQLATTTAATSHQHQHSHHYHKHQHNQHNKNNNNNNKKNDNDVVVLNSKHIQLSSGRCCKILYNLIDLNLTEDTDLIANWLKDVSILTQHISPNMFEQLSIELEENTQLIPILYRHSTDGNFQSSYIFYDN